MEPTTERCKVNMARLYDDTKHLANNLGVNHNELLEDPDYVETYWASVDAHTDSDHKDYMIDYLMNE